MNKLLLKISVYIYVFTTIILGLISPFITGLIAYKIVNPHNVFSVIFSIIVWFILSFILVIIAKYLYEGIRRRFTKIDDYLYAIENYIENQKYK